MHIKLTYSLILLFIMNIILSAQSLASISRFTTDYPCVDSAKFCSSSGYRIVDGVRVHRDCWEWSHNKTCDIPSRNDCSSFSHCYEIRLKDCIIWDRYGNCLNQRKEFSCKKRNVEYLTEPTLKYTPTGDEALRVVCSGIPCIDGNCIDKSYNMDADIMKSISQLYAASKAAGASDMSFRLFPGFSQHCTKKPSNYINCCANKGWGEVLGASCSKDERDLQKQREKKLCVYVGKNISGRSPLHIIKHHFCCFDNILNKVFQVEARKQLGIGFGSAASPDCRGLTLDEIISLDFERIDFSEFVTEIKSKMKIPNISDIDSRIRDSRRNIRKYDESLPRPEIDPANKKAGTNISIDPAISEEGEYDR